MIIPLVIALSIQCKDSNQQKTSPDPTMAVDNDSPSISESLYGTLPDGRDVMAYTLSNGKGMEVQVITLGGIITRWTAPDRDGRYQDVVLGFDRLEEYLGPHPFFGALVGRYANRIAGGRFSLDGTSYSLEKNNGPNHLHGGSAGFDKALWKAEGHTEKGQAILVLRHQSPDGDAGYPGTLEVQVTYTLTPDNALDIQYQATTDKPTIVNLTQHTYFNLSGELNETVLDHEVELVSDTFLPVDDTLIPTGEFRPVQDTPFDFRSPMEIGKHIQAPDAQIQKGGGYDHCWVLHDGEGGFRKIAEAHHPGSGRTLVVHSDESGIQFYTGNFLEGSIPGKNGVTYQPHSGFCLETQHFPDSPNQTDFPSVRLDPGETYQSRTRFTFKTR